MKTISTELLKNGATEKFIAAIKNGYEGMLWGAPLKEFMEDHHSNIILKTKMVIEGNYVSWCDNLISPFKNIAGKNKKAIDKVERLAKY